MKLLFKTNSGQHKEALISEGIDLRFENGLAANEERLKFLAQHCEGKIEVTQEELRHGRLPNIIEVTVNEKSNSGS